MDNIKRLINCHIPTSICNLRCHYCYLGQRKSSFEGKQALLKKSPEFISAAFSKERMGGTCQFHMTAAGETLMQKGIYIYIYIYIYELLKIGHYVSIVTNLTITPVIQKILQFDKELLRRLIFKCSFHYLEFKKKNLLDVFSANARAVWDAGASATIELLPNDELIPYIDEVITFSFDRFGALPHLTIARNDATAGRDYLTNLTMEEYERVWSVFDSDMWRFKRTIFGVKRNEFCYAGAWSLYVNLETGNAVPCYCGTGRQNIYDDLSKPIRFDPIGLCPLPHCYNGHALLTQGLIPRFTDYLYGNIRDRTRLDGSHWLQPEMLNFLNGKLENQNSEYCVLKQKIIISRRIAEKVFASIKKRALKIIR